MFIFTFINIWMSLFFFIISYFILLIIVLLYVLPIIGNLSSVTQLKTAPKFIFLKGGDVFWALSVVFILLYTLFSTWYGPSIVCWYGHIVFTSMQYYLLISFFILFILIISIYTQVFYFSSREIYDFFSVLFIFLFFIWFLFCSNTIFTIIFFFEVLASLVFLLIIVSSFSTTYSYRLDNFANTNYFNTNLPVFTVNSLLYFFWVSLLASLILFFFLLLFAVKFNTFDWFLVEYLFLFLVTNLDISEWLALAFVWMGFLCAFFIKGGIAPFYFWKPIFFKGLPMYFICFYVLFYYTAILMFLFFFLLIYFFEVFAFFIFLFIFLVLFGLLIFVAIICESTYLKTFFAFSSILNTLLLLLFISSVNYSDFILFL